MEKRCCRLSRRTRLSCISRRAELFSKSISVISRHIANVFAEHELEEKSNLHFLQIANSDKPVKLFSLDVIISVGYRVKSYQGTQFRRWANQVLKEHLLKGFSVNQNHACHEGGRDPSEQAIPDGSFGKYARGPRPFRYRR